MEDVFFKRHTSYNGNCPCCHRPLNGETIDLLKAHEGIDYMVDHPICPCCHREITFDDMEGE